MKRLAIIYVLVFAVLCSVFPACVLASGELPEAGNTYYVSPSGNDSNDGSEAHPWKSMYKVANTLLAGDTAIFEDGTYVETEITTFKKSGTADKPITVKARNKHKAVIKYEVTTLSNGMNNNVAKLQIIGTSSSPKSYINIRDFEITQDAPAEPVLNEDGTINKAPTGDILVKLECASNCEITGNKIHNAFEEGIKMYLASYITIFDNEIYNTEHEGMDCFAVAESVICGNRVSNFGRDGYMIKGNSCNTVVCHNLAENLEGQRVTGGNAFDIGGMSDSTSPICTKESIGYENYNSVFYSNIVHSVISDGTKSIDTGFAFLGAKDCYCISNTIIGTKTGVAFRSPSDSVNGWEWNPPVVNPIVENNIFADIKWAYTDNRGGELEKPAPINVTRDYNLFYNCGVFNDNYPINTEANSIVIDDAPALFEKYGLDWHLTNKSEAVGAGTAISAFINGFSGFSEGENENSKGEKKNYPNYEYDAERTITFELTDYEGKPRKTAPWDIGAYNRPFNYVDILSMDMKSKGNKDISAPEDEATIESIEVRKLAADSNAVILLVCYNSSDEMLACKKVPVSSLNSSITPNVSVDMKLPIGAAGGYIKAYIWQFNSLKPIETSKPLN